MWCALDGHPPVQILAPLHAGARFHVYRALVGDAEVCIKTPAAAAAGEALYRWQEENISNPTFLYRTGNAAACEASSGILARLLALEQAAIDRTAGAWNHATLGLSHWLGPDGGPGLPALLLPLHDARPLGQFERAERVDLIERMLLSLWNALADRPHGDLNESNLLIARDRSRFHIIDPGVQERVQLKDRDRTECITMFTTTPASYPILPPWEEGLGLSLVQELHELSLGWRLIYGGNMQKPNPPPRRGGRPWSPDLLAIGILYARALTGAEPFLGTWIERPAWQGQYPIWSDEYPFVAHEVLEAWERTRDTIVAHIDGLLDRPGISGPRRELARALLTLEIPDLAALRTLLRV